MNLKKIKSFFFFALILVSFYPFVKECNRRDSLGNGRKKLAKAIVTSEKHFLPNNKVSSPFTYGYVFYVDGKRYEGNTHNEKCFPGEYVIIEYIDGKPEYNSPRGYYK